MNQLIVPLSHIRHEISVLNSRFIASLAPVASSEEARAFWASIRREFSDATHHVPAWILGGGKSCTEFCSDDGEPSGTSGRPLLTVLKGSGLGNVALVVTRYFGGTLLGTGGLVKAYTEAGQTVLRYVQRAQLSTVQVFTLALPYGLLERVRLLLKSRRAEATSEDFAEQVTLVIEVPVADCPLLLKDLADLSSGTLAPIMIETKLTPIPL